MLELRCVVPRCNAAVVRRIRMGARAVSRDRVLGDETHAGVDDDHPVLLQRSTHLLQEDGPQRRPLSALDRAIELQTRSLGQTRRGARAPTIARDGWVHVPAVCSGICKSESVIPRGAARLLPITRTKCPGSEQRARCSGAPRRSRSCPARRMTRNDCGLPVGVGGTAPCSRRPRWGDLEQIPLGAVVRVHDRHHRLWVTCIRRNGAGRYRHSHTARVTAAAGVDLDRDQRSRSIGDPH